MATDDRDPPRGVPPWQTADRARRLLLARAAQVRGSTVTNRGSAVSNDLHAALQTAIREDTAASLGRAGQRLQAAVETLRAWDAKKVPDQPRERLLRVAADALYACVVQREALGLLDHQMLSQTYRIPTELWQRMGGR